MLNGLVNGVTVTLTDNVKVPRRSSTPSSVVGGHSVALKGRETYVQLGHIRSKVKILDSVRDGCLLLRRRRVVLWVCEWMVRFLRVPILRNRCKVAIVGLREV